MNFRFLLIFLFAAACTTPPSVAGDPLPQRPDPTPDGGDAGHPDGSGDGGDTPRPTVPTAFDDLPDCDTEHPSFDCVRRLFVPLHAAQLPFDAARIEKSLEPHATHVARGWKLTAHHVLAAEFPLAYDCNFDAYRYSTNLTPMSEQGCGNYLFAGGHPSLADCVHKRPLSNCVDEVPLAEVFDIVLTDAPAKPAFVPMRSRAPAEGDKVYLVGNPGFPWLTAAEREKLVPDYPLVSIGKIKALDGRAVISSNAVFPGSSGGPLLNEAGEVVGVLSSKVTDVRARNTPVSSQLLDRYAITVGVDQKMLDIIAAANATVDP